MSTEHMDKYRALYSKYIEHAVNLHNYHLVFIAFTGYDTGIALRRHLRMMRKLEIQMIRTCRDAYKETKINRKLEKKKQEAELLAWKKANPKKRGPKGKNNGKHNRSDQNSV
jgi:hypothetical protein